MYSLELQTPTIYPFQDQDPHLKHIVVPPQILDLHLLRKLFNDYQQYKAFAICLHGLTESPGILNRRRDRDPIAHGSLSVLILHLRADTNYVVPLFQALKLPMLRRLEVQIDNPQETMHDWYRYSRTVVDNLCGNGFVQLLRQSCMEEVSIWNAPLCEKDMKYLATTHQTAMRRYHKDGVTEGIYTISNGPKPR